MRSMTLGVAAISLGIDFDRGNPHKAGTAPAGDSGVLLLGCRPVFPRRSRVGGVPEWLKGTDCKLVVILLFVSRLERFLR